MIEIFKNLFPKRISNKAKVPDHQFKSGQLVKQNFRGFSTHWIYRFDPDTQTWSTPQPNGLDIHSELHAIDDSKVGVFITEHMPVDVEETHDGRLLGIVLFGECYVGVPMHRLEPVK